MPHSGKYSQKFLFFFLFSSQYLEIKRKASTLQPAAHAAPFENHLARRTNLAVIIFAFTEGKGAGRDSRGSARSTVGAASLRGSPRAVLG